MARARTMATGKEEEMAEVFVDSQTKIHFESKPKTFLTVLLIVFISVTFMICCDVKFSL